MSWFQDIAGKAETFLNAVDKGTASAISNVSVIKSSNSSRSSSRRVSASKLETSDTSSNVDHTDAEFIET